MFSKCIITGHIALCNSDNKRIRIWCCDYVHRRKRSPKLLKRYRPNQQYPKKKMRIVYKCRQLGVKNIFLSGLYSYCDYIDNTNITLNGVCRNVLHLSGKGKYVLINNHLDKICKNVLEIVQHPRMNMHRDFSCEWKAGFAGRFLNTEQYHIEFSKKSYRCLL